jgi:hypothetical protein
MLAGIILPFASIHVLFFTIRKNANMSWIVFLILEKNILIIVATMPTPLTAEKMRMGTKKIRKIIPNSIVLIPFLS